MSQFSEKLRLATWGLRTVARHGWPRALTHFSAGVGDELMLTAVVRELRQRGFPPFWVMSRRPELYRHNPDFSAVVPVDPRVPALARRCGARVVEPQYTRELPDGNVLRPPAHILVSLMATAGITGPVKLKPILTLTPAEQRAAAGWAGVIVIQPTVRSAVRPNELKEWWPERWQAVVDGLRTSHRLVQIGGAADALLDGVEDCRGHSHGLREIAAMLDQARLFVGLESGFMHLARAVDCPAVILFGGRAHPVDAGYAGNSNLFRSPACAPCWRYNGCEIDRQCMRDITPADVREALDLMLQRPRSPLPVTEVVITPEEQQRIAAALKR